MPSTQYLPLLLTLSTQALAIGTPPPGGSSSSQRTFTNALSLDDTFNVLMRSSGAQAGVCDDYFRPKGVAGQPDKKLNSMWDNSERLFYAAGHAMNDNRDNDQRARITMFAIAQENALDTQRRRVVNDQLAAMHDKLFSKISKETKKPILLCGSESLHYAALNRPMRELDLPNLVGTMGDFAKNTLHVNNPEDYWWFIVPNLGGSRAYINLPKEHFIQPPPGLPPFLRNPARGDEPDPCYNTDYPGFFTNAHGTNGPIPVVMVCQRMLSQAIVGPIDTVSAPQTSIQDKWTSDMALFALLIQYSSEGRVYPQREMHARPGVAQNQQWMALRTNWGPGPRMIGAGFVGAGMLSHFDRSMPAVDIRQQKAIYNANNYAWMSLIAYLESKTQFDWSSGRAQMRQH